MANLNKYFIFIFLWTGNFIHHSILENVIPSSLVDFWAKALSDDLVQFHKQTTGFDKINLAFEKLQSDGDFESAKRNGTLIVKEFAESLEELLQSKTEALQNIKLAAEKLEANYSYNEDDLREYKYETIRSIEENPEILELLPTFSDNVKIHTNKSFIQIPTNIYAYSPNIAAVSHWSEGLDEVFRENFNNTPGLLWQYFGSLEGPFRTYPGKLWKVDDKGRDLYDCRRRSWFIDASTSPKDMVIMIDISGTMIGNNIGIAKIAVMSLIDTLQENDFFNVIYYNKEPGYVIDCLKYLIQATANNKEAMKEAVQTMPSPQYEDKIDNALEVAFDLLEGKNRSISNCNKVIAFFSDGVEGDYAGEDVFKKRNVDKKVRVFSFLVGRTKDPPIKAMKEMSCNNRGFIYKIETIGNVWDTVLGYLNVLSRPIALSNSSALIYTTLYLDASNVLKTPDQIANSHSRYQVPIGLGMMMSAALPVMKNFTDHKDARLLGVAGTDIAMSTLEAQSPVWKLGVNGYGFAINNNGFVLFHPRLRQQLGYLPSPPNVFLEDVELLYKTTEEMETEADNTTMKNSSEIDANDLLKRRMIDRETGSIAIDVFAVGNNDTRLSKQTRHFHFMPAANTPFSVCVVIEDSQIDYHKIKADAIKDKFNQGLAALKAVENSTQTTVANWPYCDISAVEQLTKPYSIVIRASAEEIREYLDQSGHSAPKCDEELISGLLMSASAIADSTDGVWDKEKNRINGVNSVYAGTSFGYGRYLNTIFDTNGTRTPSPMARDVMEDEFYVHAAQFSKQPSPVLVFSVPVQEKGLSPYGTTPISEWIDGVSIPISVPITNATSGVIDGVVAMSLNSTYLNERLLNVTSLIDPGCISESCSAVNCRENDTYGCYLIDEGGFIVASNRGNRDVGAFIGVRQGPLLKQFKNVTEPLLRLVTLNDSQFECRRQEKPTSSASRLLMPLFSMVHAVGWGIQALSIYMAQFSASSLLYNTDYAQAQNVTPPLPEGFVSCTKAFPFYLTNNSMLPLEGSHDCGKSCRQHYALSKIAHTNLYLMVVDTLCQGACTNGAVKVEPYRAQSPLICDKHQRYRKGLANCRAEHEDESTACGGCSALKSGHIYIILCVAIHYLVHKLFEL